jgi:UDP-glucuronate 4-epimerase
MKILVTGAAGFIGSHLAENLIAQGHTVIGVDNFDDTYNPSFKEGNIANLEKNPAWSLRRIDLRDRVAVAELVMTEKPDAIAHLAAKADTRAAVSDPYPYVDNNINATLHLLDAARDAGITRFVLASSSSVYGNAEGPWREAMAADMPLSPYGATKRATELFAHAYHHNFGMGITCLRYFNVYGERNRPNMVPYQWTKAILAGEELQISGDGSRKRDYTYVGDIVRGTIAAINRDALGFEVVNLGNENPVSLKDLLSTIEAATGKTARVVSRESHKASVEVTWADVSKAKKLLGWEPETTLADGIEKLVAWYRSERLKD